jgi:hypothetical protein
MSDVILAPKLPAIRTPADRLRLTTPLDVHQRLVDIFWKGAPPVLPPPDLANLLPPAAMSLRPDQTPPKDQGDRNTCWAFAAVAALEAAYRRKHGLVLDLSEHYFFHMTKAHESFAGVSSLFGGGGNSGSVAFFDRIRIPTEAACPYLSQAELRALRAAIPEAGAIDDGVPGTQPQRDAFEFDPRHVPLSARWSARYGTPQGAWVWMRNYSNADIERVIASRREVVVDVNVGTAQNPSVHAVVIVGYDRNARRFEAKNSWSGMEWVGIPYDDNTPGQWSLLRDMAGYITDVLPPDAPADIQAAWVGQWRMDHDGWRGRLVIRRTVNVNGESPRDPGTILHIGAYRDANGAWQEVHGYFLDGGQRLVFHIVPPGAPQGPTAGQRFEVTLFGRDLWRAAGSTTYAGKPFGVSLARGLQPGLASGNFDRNESIGLWWFRHDGWTGALRLGAPAIHRDEANVQRQVKAEIQPDVWRVRASIPFNPASPQPFDLLLHTREDGVMAGTTTWSGRPFGVAAAVQAPIYARRPDGELLWYSHEGRIAGTFEWEAQRSVHRGFRAYTRLIPGGDGILYGLLPNGELHWWRHLGRRRGDAQWQGPIRVGTGWNGFQHVAGAPGGVLYAVRPDGTLLWYRHRGRDAGAFDWEGPTEVARGWAGMLHVFAGDWGTLYGVDRAGRLFWHRHDGQPQGIPAWAGQTGGMLSGIEAGQGRRAVGTGWDSFSRVFAAEGGRIYGVARDGTLRWYRHTGALTGDSSWIGHADVGTGWDSFADVCAS